VDEKEEKQPLLSTPAAVFTSSLTSSEMSTRFTTCQMAGRLCGFFCGTLPWERLHWANEMIGTNVHVRVLTIISAVVLLICTILPLLVQESMLDATPTTVAAAEVTTTTQPVTKVVTQRHVDATLDAYLSSPGSLLSSSPHELESTALLSGSTATVVDDSTPIPVILLCIAHFMSWMSICPLDCFYTTWLGADRTIAHTGTYMRSVCQLAPFNEISRRIVGWF
jgi:hypothetical protein